MILKKGVMNVVINSVTHTFDISSDNYIKITRSYVTINVDKIPLSK